MQSRGISRKPMERLESGLGTGAIKRDFEEANGKACVSSMNRCNRKKFRGNPSTNTCTHLGCNGVKVITT